MLARFIALQVQSLRWEVNRFERALRFRGRKPFLRPDDCALQCSGERAIDPNLQVEVIAIRGLEEKDSFEQNDVYPT